MTQIPSDIPASAAQAGFQANDIARERETRRAGQADASRKQARSIEEAGSTVDTDDADVAVFGESEGAGSQGREENEAADEEPTEDNPGQKHGITKDDDGQIHVDLEA